VGSGGRAWGGVWLPAGWSGNVGGGTERGVRVAAMQRGSAGRVAVSGRYPPGRVIRCRSRYPADRVTGTACYPCGRVTSGIRVTLQARRPGNPSAAVTLPARSPPPKASPSLCHRRFRSSRPDFNSSLRSPCNALITQRAIRDPSYPALAHGPHHGSGSRRADPAATSEDRPKTCPPYRHPRLDPSGTGTRRCHIHFLNEWAHRSGCSPR